MNGSLKGRLRAFIWRIVGPPLETQRQFNAALVDHLNRNVHAHEESAKATRAPSRVLKDETRGARPAAGAPHPVLCRRSRSTSTRRTARSAAAGRRQRRPAARSPTTGSSAGNRWRRAKRGLAAPLATIDDVRATAAIAQQTALSLKRDVERLLARGVPDGGVRASEQVGRPARAARPGLVQVPRLRRRVSRIARGDPRRLAEYVPQFAGATDVLDIGCGRGEFLELLRAAGHHAPAGSI